MTGKALDYKYQLQQGDDGIVEVMMMELRRGLLTSIYEMSNDSKELKFYVCSDCIASDVKGLDTAVKYSQFRMKDLTSPDHCLGLADALREYIAFELEAVYPELKITADFAAENARVAEVVINW